MRLTLVLIASLSFATTLLPAQTTTNQITKDNRTISISAGDHAEADPEVADVNIGFTAYGATLPEAYKSASQTSNAVIKAVLAAGAQKDEIHSQSQQVARLQDYEMKTQRGMKFRVQQSWTVSVAPKDAALVLDAAIQSGANQGGDIGWRMKSRTALDTEATRLATEKAHALAAELAKAMGVTLGKPLYATNSISNNFIGPRPMGIMMARSAEAAPAPLAIEAQRVESTATVEIVYAIE